MLSSFIPRKSITRKSFTSMKILSLAKVRIATHTALCVGVYLSVIETTFRRNSEAENFPMMKNFSGENLGSFLPRKLDCHMRCSSLEVLTVIRSVTCRPGSFWEGSPAEACDSRTCFTCQPWTVTTRTTEKSIQHFKSRNWRVAMSGLGVFPVRL